MGTNKRSFEEKRNTRKLLATITNKKSIRMKFILSVVVMVCVWEVAFTQGPRSCDQCHELEEEIGQKMKGRTPLIALNQLRNLCPTFNKANSTEYCNFVVTKWETVLIEEKKRKNQVSIIETIFNWFNWFYIPQAITDYKSLCQLVDIRYFS